MITIKSFGYGHPGGAPAAHLTVNLCDLFKDPHVSPEMRELTGKDPKVIQSVMRQPGAEAFLRALIDGVLDIRHPDPVIAFGCVGGRHRSVVFADALAQELRAWFRLTSSMGDVTVEHRDIDKPVLAR
jgi:RNase adaptor protein for sRNA GlmZ degradation